MSLADQTGRTKGLENVQAVKGRSLWMDARIRFFRNKAAVASLIILVLLALFALFGQMLTQYDHSTIDFMVRTKMATDGGPSLSNGHWFGYDSDGRDLFARVAQGTGISMMVGLIGALIAVFVGTLYGAISGYIGGRTDQIMMRIVDILYSIPFMFVLILMLVIFGRSILMLFVGIGLISWLGMARIARGQTLSIKNKEFIEAAIATGVSPLRIVVRHVVPNLLGIVVVYATILVPEMIIYESFISFLGLGVQEPDTSLGALLSMGASQINYGYYWMLGYPLFVFVLMLYAFYYVGDGLRDALDPKDR